VAGSSVFDVLYALGVLGIDYQEEAGEAWARCPGHLARTGHADSSPSWSINVKSGLHNCFSCGFSGDVVSLTQQVLGLDYAAASGVLAAPGAASAALARLRTKIPAAPRLRGPAVDLEGFTLPPPRELAKRRIDQDAAARFEILWSGDAWVFPIRHPVTFELMGYQLKRQGYVRNVPRGVRKGLTLFGIGAYTGTRAIPVESPLDTARIWCAGEDGALATFGSQVTDHQIRLLLSIADELVLAMDNDAAGRLANEEIEAAVAGLLPVRRFAYPAGTRKDPGELEDNEVTAGIAHATSRLQRAFHDITTRS